MQLRDALAQESCAVALESADGLAASGDQDSSPLTPLLRLDGPVAQKSAAAAVPTRIALLK